MVSIEIASRSYLPFWSAMLNRAASSWLLREAKSAYVQETKRLAEKTGLNLINSRFAMS